MRLRVKKTINRDYESNLKVLNRESRRKGFYNFSNLDTNSPLRWSILI